MQSCTLLIDNSPTFPTWWELIWNVISGKTHSCLTDTAVSITEALFTSMWVWTLQSIKACLALCTFGPNDIPFTWTLPLLITLCVTRVSSFGRTLARPKMEAQDNRSSTWCRREGTRSFQKKKKTNAKLNFVLMISKLTYNLSVKTQRSLAGICHIWDLSLQVYKCTGLLDHTVTTLTPQGHTYKADSHLKKSGGRSCHGIVRILDQLYFSCSFHSAHSQGCHHTHNCLLNHYSHTLKKQLWRKYILSVITRSFRLKPSCKDRMYSY